MSKSFSTSINKAAGKGIANLIPMDDQLKPDALQTSTKIGRPVRKDKDNKNAPAAERGTKPGETRKTYLVEIEKADQLEAVAYWDRKTVKEVVAEAFSQYLEKYVKKNGTIEPIPLKK